MRLVERMQQNNGVFHLARYAHGDGMLAVMHRRHIDDVARENLEWVIQACARRVGKARGGAIYLARLLNTPETHLSAIRHGKRNLRELKDRIEKVFRLSDGWMDREHDETVVAELVPRVPSLPNQRSTGTPAARSAYAELQDSVAELQRQISELKSQLASGSKPRK